jgi:sensor domain CHASE-containing protein
MAGISLHLLSSRMSASYELIENADIRNHMAEMGQAFEASAASLTSQTNDWAVWSDMYRFVQSPKKAWSEENLSSKALEVADLSLVMIFAKDGRLLSGQWWLVMRKKIESSLPNTIRPF